MRDGPSSSLCIGDLHGLVEKLLKVVRSEIYGDNVRFGIPNIFHGDAVDGGPQAQNYLTLKLLIQEVLAKRLVWLPGNHDWSLYRLVLAIMRYLDKKADTVDFKPKENQERLVEELFALKEDEFRSFAKTFMYVFECLPRFVRVNNTYFAHAGWDNQMLSAEDVSNRGKAIRVRRGIYTARLSVSETYGQNERALLGWGMTENNDITGAIIKDPPVAEDGRKRFLVIGHHTNAVVKAERVHCIDTGCGKVLPDGSEGYLTAVMVNTIEGNILRTFTF